MSIIIGVRFGKSSKSYYFSPKDGQFAVGDHVIVETARGQEYATVNIANKDVPEGEIVAPLKEIVRATTPDDDKRAQENEVKNKEAFKLCAKKIEAHKLNMRLVEAEYTFDRSKVVFSFTADSRVDFRELVKDIASEMHMRIELRQIYERDDVKLKGAMGVCGRPCCCIEFLGDHEKATVKMAKNQNLSLNPAKVSGMCGKLMCCLKYENEFYASVGKKMPKLYSRVNTADGIGRVEEIDTLGERIKVSIPKGEEFALEYYAVGEFEILPADNEKPHPKKERTADAEVVEAAEEAKNE